CRPFHICLLPTCIHHILITLIPFTQTAPPDIYTLSLHDALPISSGATTPGRFSGAAAASRRHQEGIKIGARGFRGDGQEGQLYRSEEHTSELQSRVDLVCRLLLEKKKRTRTSNTETRTI